MPRDTFDRVEASEEFVQKCDVDSTFAYLCLNGEQDVCESRFQMLLTLRIVVVKKLLAKVVSCFHESEVDTLYSFTQQLSRMREQLASLKRLR